MYSFIVWLKILCTKFFSISIEFSAMISQTDFSKGPEFLKGRGGWGGGGGGEEKMTTLVFQD